MVAVAHSMPCRHYMGRIRAKLRELKGPGRGRAKFKPPKWSLQGVVSSEGGTFSDIRERARVNINNHYQYLPQLARLCKPAARPGWAFRDQEGAKPTGEAFAADPGKYVLHLLDRTSDLFVNPKWKKSPPELTEGEGCMRFAMTYAVVDADGELQPELSNMRVPVRIPPRLQGRRRIRTKRRHYCEVTDDDFVRLYLGVDAEGKPVKEYLHRLIMLAFGPEQPNASTGQGEELEVSHACGNKWCGNSNHLCWAAHATNCKTDPGAESNVLNKSNVGRHYKTQRELQRERSARGV